MYLLVAVMVIVTFAQVFFRYVVFYSIPWSEELARYALVWLSAVGASYGIKRNIHVAVDVVVQALPQEIRSLIIRINYLLIAAFGLVLVVYGLKISQVNMGQLSPSLHIPIGLVYAAMPVGGLFIIIHALAFMVPETQEEVKD
jgi:TRAP-type C4-dicarboxylate transport system permease small subunit